jgi:hypothetical protein
MYGKDRRMLSREDGQCPLCALWELLLMSSSITLLLWAIASSVMRMEPEDLPAKLVNCPALVYNIHKQD